MRVLVVGAGFSGAVIARQLAEADVRVTVLEKRSHVAGNAFDFMNEYGIRVHKYGPHIFHTSNANVFKWLSKFTEWVDYKHKVKALLADGSLVTLPVNIETSDIVGRSNIIDVFYRPYTKKMWGVDLDEIDPSILDRVPVRNDMNEYYFPNDIYQALPKHGYANLVSNILNHKNINVRLGMGFDKSIRYECDHTFNSMPIDEFFDYQFGELPYRSIFFHHHTVPVPRLFPVATVNFTHNHPFTRLTEWKNFPNHGSIESHTSITIEEPCDYKQNMMERYYPIKDTGGKNRKIYEEYKKIRLENVTFIGRCGLYAYLDMDQAVSSALSISRNFLARTPSQGL